MARFCTKCGTQMDDQARFCPNCGVPIAPGSAAPSGWVQPSAAPFSQTPVAPGPAAPSGGVQPSAAPFSQAPLYAADAERRGIPFPGFSDRVNHPEILAAFRKSRKASKGFAFILAVIPLIGFPIYSLSDDKMELSQAIMYGGILSAIFLGFAVFGFIRANAKNSYEATVIDKKTRAIYSRDSADSTRYITVVRTTTGKQKKIVEHDSSQLWAWDYLQVGDRFRYHPQFNFPYELYDKSRAPYLACVSCTAQNPVGADRCRRCNLPLLK